MEVLFVIFTLMGGSILILLKLNKNLRAKNKLKDLEVEDVKLKTEQNYLKKEKEVLKESLINPKIDVQDLDDQGIENFWKNKKKK